MTPILSVCISTYNRHERCVGMVRGILGLNDWRINVCVCDDCSEDGTYDELNAIKDKRLLLKRNKENMGACKNWYETINKGNGKYLLHILDRDILNVKCLLLLVNMLEKYDISSGYIGSSSIEAIERNRVETNAYIYAKGGEAFCCFAGVPVHPTGFLVKRTYWKKSMVKKYFYQQEKYGIYPHSYVFAHMALAGDMMLVPINNFYTIQYTGITAKSRFYEKSVRKDYWWMPKSVMNNTFKTILELERYAAVMYKEDFIINKFKEGLYRSTIVYKNIVQDGQELRHYDLETHNVSFMELAAIVLRYYIVFEIVIGKMNIGKKEINRRLLREVEIWWSNKKY